MPDILKQSALQNSNDVLNSQVLGGSVLQNHSNILDINKLCFAPSELFGEEIAKGFGIIAEPFINFNLTEYFSRNMIAPRDIYQDYSFEGSIDKTLAGFIKLKNPTINPLYFDLLSTVPHKRPDILIDSGTIKDYYEIKPNSPSGRYAGRRKLSAIDTYMNTYGLPYVRGPLLDIPEFVIGRTAITINGVTVPIQVSLNFETVNGLILYKVCIETQWRLILNAKHVFELLEAIVELLKDIITRTGDVFEELAESIKDLPWRDMGMAILVVLAIIGGSVLVVALAPKIAAALALSVPVATAAILLKLS
ncbi:hypothetical protein JKA74_20005 [Marivirga sp. S37H4]|uniref:Uncharacterized protein n=1 Tax=Marivirga aurantiaca TaxID=2802615 RepID=A0A934X2P0_9BACT|nr:hypothetical protein [Marivirga aurantiaca]MBK6267337.1 hypothetical protein [Marivirga aurantiaca]